MRGLGGGDVQWLPESAWVFEQAMGLVSYDAKTNPVMRSWVRHSLDRQVAAPELGSHTGGSLPRVTEESRPALLGPGRR